MDVTPNFKVTINKAVHNKWDKQAKKWLSRLNITYCEIRLPGCMGNFGLTPAHSKKRRKINSTEVYAQIAAACAYCHDFLDLKMSPDEMDTAVNDAIAKRDECS